MTLYLNGTTGISGVDGSSGTPAVQGTDTNTGISFPAADTVAVNTGGSERSRVDSSGRLLVGTSSARSVGGQSHLVQFESANSSPFSGLSIVGNSNDSNGSYLILGKSRGTSAGSNTVIQNNDQIGGVFFAAADGNGINGSAGRITCEIDGTPGANDLPGRIVLSTTADGASSPTERMRITNGGGVLIGCTAFADVGISLSSPDASGAYFRTNSSGSINHLRFHNPNGVVGSITTSASSTAYNTSSDYRLKENVTPVTDGITRLQQLKPSRFNFIADPGTVVDGFIAHEAQAVVPECVTGVKDAVDDDGNPIYQGIDQSKLVPLLTAALQEAVARIETLEAKVAALESA